MSLCSANWTCTNRAQGYARIAKNHGLIVVEDLRVRNMMAGAVGTVGELGRNIAAKAGLNRSMLDIAPFQIRQMLEYKVGWYGSRVIAVNPAHTSQNAARAATSIQITASASPCSSARRAVMSRTPI
jgi:IS605 OrfB family transposase